MSINLVDLSFSYGSLPVLERVNLQLEQKETVSILGPNGAGKTTLLNIMAGLLSPTTGDVFIDGKKNEKMSPRQRAFSIGYVPQSIAPAFDYSVLEYVVTGCAPRIGTFERPKKQHYEIALTAMEDMGIVHLAKKSYMQISGGERQQVSIAKVITQQPTYILMDEPTSHLDFGNQIRVLKTIRRLTEKGFGVIFTTHNPDHVLLLGDKVAVINRKGQLHCGSCEEIISKNSLSKLYGTEICLTRPPNIDRDICFAPNLNMEEPYD